MSVSPTYPGVYVQEIPSGVRTIVGVSTSVTAFLGLAKRGPINKAVHIFSLKDYENTFGGLSKTEDFFMSYAVSQFFLNGGNEAWIVRLGLNAKAASLEVNDSDDKLVLTITAVDEGTAGNDIQVIVDNHSPDNTINSGTFNLTLIYNPQDDPADARTEIFKGLSMNPESPHFAEDVINDVSLLVQVKVKQPVTGIAKLPQLSRGSNGKLTSDKLVQSDIAGIPSDSTSGKNSFMISFDGNTPNTIVTLDTKTPLVDPGQGLAKQLNDIASRIQKAVRNAKPGLPTWGNFTCTVSLDETTNPTKGQLILTSGVIDGPAVQVAQAAKNDIAASLKLDTGTSKEGSKVAHLGQDPTKQGKGDPFVINDNPGVFFPSDGNALDKVDIFNLLCMPGVTDAGTINQAIAYCQQRRAFVIVDPPPNFSPAQMVKYITDPNLSKGDAGTYAAIYYPWVKAPDPLKNGKLTSYPPSGIIAGLYARTDSTRGVWKAPAGTEANLSNVMGLDYLLTDGENGVLNQLGVNCLRIFPIYGPVSWGSRTVNGADAAADQYKYIPVRRTALYIEESLRRGLQWVVFEPNDEPLWAQIRLNVGAFMHNLFVKGAFQGNTPRDAYFVKCDKETTTQNDIDLGKVNIIVGFAPLKPAEFVIISLQQIAGQLQV